MQKWDYYVVHIHGDHWGDSDGKQGKLPTSKVPGGGDWHNCGTLLDAAGDQGWELVGTAGSGLYSGTPHLELFFKRPAPQ